MNEKKEPLLRLVQDIFATQEDEIQCDAAADQMVLSTTAFLSDEESQLQYPMMWRHFRFCADCAAEYQMLLDLAEMEAAGQLEMPPSIPPLSEVIPPERIGRWPLLQNAITALFAGFGPSLALQRRTRSRPTEPQIGDAISNLAPTEVTLADGRITMTFIVAENEDPELRDLDVTIETAAADLKDQLGGASVWLQLADEGPAIAEETVDKLEGVADDTVESVTFERVPPGTYMVRLRLAGQEYAVLGITLP